MRDHGDADVTRAALLREARIRFALHPYTDVTLRAIAADAGVSASLVIKYFGSKDDLLREVVQFDEVFTDLLSVPNERLGRHLVERLLAHTEEPDAIDPFMALVLMAVGRDAPDWVRRELLETFVERLASRLVGRDAQLRAELVCGHLIGLSSMRRVLDAPALTACSATELADRFGPVLQTLIDVGPRRTARLERSRVGSIR